MCGRRPKTPKVIERDPIAEQRKAEADAQLKANRDLAGQRRRRQASGGSLLRQQMATRQESGRSLLAQADPGGV